MIDEITKHLSKEVSASLVKVLKNDLWKERVIDEIVILLDDANYIEICLESPNQNQDKISDLTKQIIAKIIDITKEVIDEEK
jgi:hypothetical protein